MVTVPENLIVAPITPLCYYFYHGRCLLYYCKDVIEGDGLPG